MRSGDTSGAASGGDIELQSGSGQSKSGDVRISASAGSKAAGDISLTSSVLGASADDVTLRATKDMTVSSLGETLISSGGDKPVTIEAGNKAGSVSLEAGLSEDSAVPGGSVAWSEARAWKECPAAAVWRWPVAHRRRQRR